MKKLLIIATFICLINPLHISGQDVKAGWKAGVARVIITPRENMWMAGYASRTKPAEGKLHDLWAKALFLEDKDGNRAILITTDLIGFNNYLSDRIRNSLKMKFGLSEDQIILSSSHTHSGPALQSLPLQYLAVKDSTGEYSSYHLKLIKEYSDRLEREIVDLAGRASESMEPVKIFSGQGVARFAVNRRVNGARTTVTELVQELDGPVDHSVPVIKVERQSGEMMAVIFGYACHSTTLSLYQWSGDYPGFAQSELEKLFPGITAMFFAGAGADQNPLPRRKIAYAVQYGKTLAASVEAVINEPMTELSPRLYTSYTEVGLDYGYPPPPSEEELRLIMDESSNEPPYIKIRANILMNQLQNGESQPGSYLYPVQLWNIGGQKMIILGGEVVVDYALTLKQIFGKDIFVMAYANEMTGYIPSLRVYSEGGYEGSRAVVNGIVFNRPWAPDTEFRILKGVIGLAEEAGN
jgi:neutral ceramidase